MWNPNEENKKDRELKQLREQVRILKRTEPNVVDHPERILNHYSQTESPNSNETPKNAEVTQRGKGQETNIKDMKKYLADVLATINAFDKQLTEQSSTDPTRSEM